MGNIIKKTTSILLAMIMIVAYMPMMAFAATETIASGTCGENATWELDSEGVLTISGTGGMDNYTFYNTDSYSPWYGWRKSIKEVVISSDITSIGNMAFYNCSITTVKIQDGVKSIGEEAFYYCESLESITIPGSVTSIGQYAFQSCSNLKTVKIQDGVKSIGEYVFVFCESLESIIIPGSVTSIGQYAFFGCSNLKTVKIQDGVKSIGRAAFDSCQNLESITIPASVTSIGEYAFIGCINLKTVKIQDGVKSIGKYAFSSCESIKSITIPGSVTSIGEYAFIGCINLKTVSIQNGVKSIGKYAFDYCESLASITIPASVVKIGTSAFTNAVNPTYVFYSGNKTQWNAIAKSSNSQLANAVIHYNATGHTYKDVITRATLSKNGKIVKKCSKCGKVKSTTLIYRPTKFTLSTSAYAYDGKIKKPTVTVKNSAGKTLVKDTDYTLTYASGRKYVGKYSVKITFKGKYSGSKTLYFKIYPPKTSLTSLTASSKGFTAKWSKKTTQVTGYQIQYSTSSKFTNPKTVTITKNSTAYKKITRLTAKKKYYVRVRIYKTVGKTNYYCSWSGYKYVTTKA